MTTPDQQTEKAIQEAGANVAPRVTPNDVRDAIASEHYFTAADGVHESGDWDPCMPLPQGLHLLTFCVLVLRNGYTVTGESACASSENFNAQIGRDVARQNAVAKIWPLLGFELRTKLSAAEGGAA